MKEDWNLSEAVSLCRKLAEICPEFGAHVALTGGTLYKDGYRKDVDILFYRIRQTDAIDITGLLSAIEEKAKVQTVFDYGFVVKAILVDGEIVKHIDIFFPERNYEKYPAADLGNGSYDQ